MTELMWTNEQQTSFGQQLKKGKSIYSIEKSEQKKKKEEKNTIVGWDKSINRTIII